MRGNSRHTDASKRLRPVFIGASVLLIALLGFFAYSLAHSQNQQRRDAERLFSDRAQVAASVNDSIFQLITTQAVLTDSQQLGGPAVSSQALARRIAQNLSLYEMVIDARGKVLAQAGHVASNPEGAALAARAIRGATTEYSSAFAGPGGAPIIESATAFPTKFGQRVDISGVNATLFSKYLDGFLGKLPSVSDTRSYVVDANRRLIAAPGIKLQAGSVLGDRALAAAIAKGIQGPYDGGRYYASAPITGTPWRIVLSTDQSDLYSSVKTTVPWIIFGAFVLMSALGLFLVRRMLYANAELERAELSRRHALEINDNIVQRLVLAKYALDRGATETSQQKLAETLRETQQLVTSMLEEKEIVPGSLRREAPAGTDRPPEPAAPSWQAGR
jgi:hypothetical protein